MASKIIITILCMSSLIDAVITGNYSEYLLEDESISDNELLTNITGDEYKANAFDGVYTKCLLYLSYTCLQKKTLLYINQLNNMSEVSFFGDHIQFVKINKLQNEDEENFEYEDNSENLALMIDKSVDRFFENHILKVNAIGRDLTLPVPVEDFVGRKKRKGGDGGGKGDDFGKKKMMMMAMMCMKMKFMMMVPAMMGMMGMMSFKGMMFSMMTFMISKMMLLMKILEKKGSLGGGSGGDGGWAAGGGGGGAWMPAGGQDFGSGGGYDANGQWQSRSIFEKINQADVMYDYNKPIISYVKPVVSVNNNIENKKPMTLHKNLNDELISVQPDWSNKSKPRRKRSIMDVFQNAYSFWMNKVLGNVNMQKYNPPKYKVVNGVKYVYHPYRQVLKYKSPKQIEPMSSVPANEALTPIITVEDFNKGEIVEPPLIESRMNKKKLNKIKNTVNETVEDNPWK